VWIVLDKCILRPCRHRRGSGSRRFVVDVVAAVSAAAAAVAAAAAGNVVGLTFDSHVYSEKEMDDDGDCAIDCDELSLARVCFQIQVVEVVAEVMMMNRVLRWNDFPWKSFACQWRCCRCCGCCCCCRCPFAVVESW